MPSAAKSKAASTVATIRALTPDRLCRIMRDRGCRIETVTDGPTGPILRSATSGFGFEVRFNNRLGDQGDRYADAVFLAALRVQGELPLKLVNEWNNTRRFARLHLLEDYLILAMDVSVAGGVTTKHLRIQVEIWDRLVQDLIPYIRKALDQSRVIDGAEPATASPDEGPQPVASTVS